MIEHEPLINGREYGWADITVTIGGIPVVGITAIDYKEVKDKANVYGAGSRPVSRGYGRITASGSITLLASTAMALEEKAKGKSLYNIAPFTITVSYQPEGLPIKTDILKNCEFKESGYDWKEGDMSKDVKLELLISHIKKG